MGKNIQNQILENLPFAYAMHKIILDSNGSPTDYEYVQANRAFEKFTGLKLSNILGRRVTEILPSIKHSKFNWIKYYGDIAVNGGENEIEQYSEELQKWYKVRVFSPMKEYFITFFIDITQEVEKKNLYKGILSSLDEGILATDLDFNITMVNDAAEKIIDMSRDVILKENIPTILKKYNVRDIEKTNEKLIRIINEGAIIRDGEITISKNLDGNYKDVNILYNVYPIKNEQGKISGTVVSFLDITDRIEKQNKIDYMTYHDSLTGTFNRTFFTNEIKNIDIKDNLPISIIMGDVNGLKLTNDAFGHLLGDKLLITAVEVMKKSCKENDLIVRWGGDEFIILLPNTDEKQVQKISDRIKSECENERIDSIALSISIGYSTKSSIEEDIMKVINTSEDMMYRIKMVESRSQKSKTLKVITQTLQEKSFQDVEHSKNVSKLCRLIGKEMGMSSKELSELEILGDIHDIGKVTINEDVLNKKGVLNSQEWKDVKKHSEVGYHIALSSPELSFLADSILAHHERYDGFGYPKGLKGEEIPQYARMLAIADAFDSMAGYRVYRNKMSKREIINEFKDCSGKHFDPKLVKVFIDKVVENKWIQDIYFKVDN